VERGRRDNVSSTFGRGAPTKFGRATSKIRCNFWQMSTLIANNSGIDRRNENPKSKWSTTTPLTLGLNIWWTLAINKKVIGAHVDPPNWTFLGDYISELIGRVPSNFFTHLKPLNCISSQTWGAGQPQVGLPNISRFILFYSFIYFATGSPSFVGRSPWNFAAWSLSQCTL